MAPGSVHRRLGLEIVGDHSPYADCATCEIQAKEAGGRVPHSSQLLGNGAARGSVPGVSVESAPVYNVCCFGS